MSVGSNCASEGKPTLQAFRVGPEELYAAYDAPGALALANQEYGEAYFDLAEVQLCDPATLERPAFAWAGGRLGPVGQVLRWMSGPGHLCNCPP